MSNRFAPFVVALEEHYWDLDLVAHFPGREGKRLSQVEERPAGHRRACASRKWMRRASTCRCSRTARPARRRWKPEPAVELARADQRSSGRDRAGQSEALRRLSRIAADARSRRPPPRARSHRHQARLQGRDDPRPHQRRCSSTTSGSGRSSSAPPRSTCRSICTRPSRIRRSIDVYYKDYLSKYPRAGRCRRSASPWRPRRRACAWCSAALFDAYPKLKVILGHLGEGIPFLLVAHRPDAVAAGQSRRLAFREMFCEHFYLTTSGNFLRPRRCVCSMHGDGRRPHHVLGRLALRAEQDGHRLAGSHADFARRQGQDLRRQCAPPAAALTRCWSQKSTRRRLRHACALLNHSKCAAGAGLRGR